MKDYLNCKIINLIFENLKINGFLVIDRCEQNTFLQDKHVKTICFTIGLSIIYEGQVLCMH